MSETCTLIRRLREAGMSQTDIARLTGIPQPRISRWERGQVAKGADDALRLAALERELVNGGSPSVAGTVPAETGQLDHPDRGEDPLQMKLRLEVRRSGPTERRATGGPDRRRWPRRAEDRAAVQQAVRAPRRRRQVQQLEAVA